MTRADAMVKRLLRSLLIAGVLIVATLLCGWKLTRSPGTQPGHTDLDQALLAAIRDGDRASVQSLLEGGADVNGRDEEGITPLMQAALNADPDLLKLLLARGADPRAEDRHQANALLRAVHDLNKVKLLLGHGARVRDDEVVLAAMVP